MVDGKENIKFDLGVKGLGGGMIDFWYLKWTRTSYKNFKAKPERAIGLYSCESICIIFAPIMLIFRATSLKYCYLHVLNFYLENGVMTTPISRILSFVFTVLPFKKSLLIIHEEMAKNKNAYFLQEKCILK